MVVILSKKRQMQTPHFDLAQYCSVPHLSPLFSYQVPVKGLPSALIGFSNVRGRQARQVLTGAGGMLSPCGLISKNKHEADYEAPTPAMLCLPAIVMAVSTSPTVAAYVGTTFLNP